MKKLVFGLITMVSFSMTSCAQNVIGIISGGKYIITIKTNEIKLAGEKHLATIGLKTVLTTFEILQDKVQGTDEIYYMLLVQNSDGNVKLAATLELSENQFLKRAVGIFDNSATCSGCTRGCSPRRHMDNGLVEWYCSACTVGIGCKKTETGY